MDAVFIPNESDFKRWIKEAVKEVLEGFQIEKQSAQFAQEPLLSRKEVAFMFKISLVTLDAWKKGGLPSHKQGGRVYFLHSEILAYIKQKKKHFTFSQSFTS